MEQMKNSVLNNTVSSLQPGGEKLHHSLEFLEWFWELCVSPGYNFPVGLHGIRESVTTADGLSSLPLFIVSLLLHNGIAAGMSKAYLHNLEFLEEEVPVNHINSFPAQQVDLIFDI